LSSVFEKKKIGNIYFWYLLACHFQKGIFLFLSTGTYRQNRQSQEPLSFERLPDSTFCGKTSARNTVKSDLVETNGDIGKAATPTRKKIDWQ
jgi:hypothetical protein